MISFDKIARYLTNPLILIGFLLLFFYGIHELLITSGILPPVDSKTSGIIVQVFLGYGFWIAVLVVLLGFGLQFYKTHQDSRGILQQGKVDASVNINNIVQALLAKHRQDLQAKDEQIKELTKAVTAVYTGQGIAATQSELSAALAALAQGNTTLAKSLFAKTAEKAEQPARQGAEALRNLGALAFLDNPQEALQAYRRATQLDPDNTDGWNRLGILLHLAGKHTEAIAIHTTVLALGEKHRNKHENAVAFGNLGNAYRARGELVKAEEFLYKAFELDKDIGNKEGMANGYNGLGSVYHMRGDPDKAIEFYNKSLKLNKELGNKEGIANNYGNLGLVYERSDQPVKAEEFHNKALELYKKLGFKVRIAATFCNLGNAYRARGELVKAEEFYKKALELDKELGSEEGMAIDYKHLGSIYFIDKKPVKAIVHYEEALKLDKKLDRKVSMAENFSNLGNAYRARGELVKAGRFYKKGLKLDKELGSEEGMADNYANLGILYALQNNKNRAICYCLKSLKLYEQIDSPKAKTISTVLDKLQ